MAERKTRYFGEEGWRGYRFSGENICFSLSHGRTADEYQVHFNEMLFDTRFIAMKCFLDIVTTVSVLPVNSLHNTAESSAKDVKEIFRHLFFQGAMDYLSK